MLLKRDLSICDKFERFWQESLDAPRPRWDEYWFDVAWSDHLATCEPCRQRNQKYRKLALALEQWNPAVGEVPDLSESSLRLWKDRPRTRFPAAAPAQPPKARGLGSLWKRWREAISRRSK
jgi:hypothetical protein